MTTRFCVTRQSQWPDGDYCVEISSGDFDYVNPGQVGSVNEFPLAVDVVEYAIELAQAWQAESEEEVFIGRGYTHGCTMPFDCKELCEDTYKEFRAWAAKHDEQLPKCDCCGEVIGEEWKNNNSEWTGFVFCSESCADKDQEDEDRFSLAEELSERKELILVRLRELQHHPLWQTQEYLYLILEDDDSVSVTDTSVHTAGTAWACWDEGDSIEDIANNLLGT